MKKWVIICLCMVMGTLSLQAEEKDEKLTLRFTDAELRGVLEVLNRTTDYNIIFPDDISGQISIKMKDLTPPEALDRVFRRQKYSFLIDGKNVIVYKKGSVSPIQYTFKLQYVTADEVRAMLTGLIANHDSYTETVASGKQMNTVSVVGSIQTIRNAMRLIKTVDVPPKQVLMKTKILEIKKQNGDSDIPTKLGADFVIESSSNPDNFVSSITNSLARTEPITGGIYAQILNDNIAAYLTAVERRGDTELLASPWLTALNHHEASILIGSKLAYKTTTTTETSTQEVIKFIDIGIKLVFTPHISDDGLIRISLEPSISDAKIIDGIPQINTTETFNEVLIRDGETLVIGGLSKISENEIHTGIPVLSSLPFIGGLFGKVELQAEKRDLMIVITPSIITPEHLTKLKEDSEVLERKVLNSPLEQDMFPEGDDLFWEEDSH